MGGNGHGFVPKVMIVDSYGSNIRSLSEHLNAWGAPLEILPSRDAEATLARLKAEPVDLVIIDTNLRGKLNGFELCRAMKSTKTTENIPVILVLVGSLSLERQKGIRAGADLLLHRPVLKEEFLKMVQLLLADKIRAGQSSPESQPLRRLFSVA